MFEPQYPVEKLVPASYNPREIEDDALVRLSESISEVGFVKPVIVTSGNVIVAGHQRLNASKRMGRADVPAWVLGSIKVADEVWFNQLHNGTDLDEINVPIRVSGLEDHTTGTFHLIDPAQVEGSFRASNAGIRREICSMLVKYGNWGCAVVTRDGEVISSPQYLLAAKTVDIQPRVYVLPDEKVPAARKYLTAQYGRFSYDRLRKETWVQSFAQPFRLRDGATVAQHSHLYEYIVIPDLESGEFGGRPRILDFGCGQGDYVKLLGGKGYEIFGVEFFARRGNALDVKAVHQMCEAIEHELSTRGRFDFTVADCVVNSTDSQQAEEDVFTCISALCKPNGNIYYAGRKLERLTVDIAQATKSADNRRYVEFLDKDNRSARYKMGTWFYQKWHSIEQVKEVAERYYGKLDALRGVEAGFSNWQAMSVKRKELDQKACEEALWREFELMWPFNRTVGFGDRIVKAFRKALEMEKGG